MTRLTAEFSAAFARDLKEKARRRNGDLYELQRLHCGSRGHIVRSTGLHLINLTLSTHSDLR